MSRPGKVNTGKFRHWLPVPRVRGTGIVSYSNRKFYTTTVMAQLTVTENGLVARLPAAVMT